MIYALITLLGGILAASGFIIARKPNAKELIDKITPYQGWIGIVLFFWGAWSILWVITCLSFLSVGGLQNILYFLIIALNTFSDLFVGFLLGFGILSKWFLSKNEEAMAKGQRIRSKLMKFQIPLGFISIAVGMSYLFFCFGLWLVGYIAFIAVMVFYVIIIFAAGKPQTGDTNDSPQPQTAAATTNQNQTAAQKQNTQQTQTQNQGQTTANSNNNAGVAKGGTFYETKISNVTCVPVGATFKVGMTITAKKFVVDAKTGKEKEEPINDEIQIGMAKGGKDIYLKSYKFTKTVTSLSLALDQKPDKIGIDPYNKLAERW